MKVLHVVARMGRDAGGLARSSQGLVAALCKAGVDAWIWPLDGAEPWIEGVRKVSGIVGFKQAARTPLPRSWRLDEFDLVHIHGIWEPRLHKVAAMCRKAGVPYVIAPRGMLEPWSLKQKWFKKRIARWLYQDRDLKLSAALHATAESEAEQLRRLGFKNKIIISPNGVNVPDQALGTKHQALGTDEKRRALFVSRMHPKKGVLELVESWARVMKAKSKGAIERSEIAEGLREQRWVCELVYTVSGPEEKAYEQKVKDRILALGMTYKDKDGTIHPSPSPSPFAFIFTGPLDDAEKWTAYARADLFILPTYSENFGIVVAEALWAGVPVITTKGTPWAELEERKCGWWVELPSAEAKAKGEGEGRRRRAEAKGEEKAWNALDNALREAISLPVTFDCSPLPSPSPLTFTSLQEMGARGHQLVAERYTWEAVCDKMVRGYEAVLKAKAKS